MSFLTMAGLSLRDAEYLIDQRALYGRVMANPELFNIRVRNRPSQTTVAGVLIRTSIPTRKDIKKKHTRKVFTVIAKAHAHDKKNLRCTYCHEQGELTDTVICDNKVCNAVYHLECWNESRSTWRTGNGCSLRDCRSTTASPFTEKVKKRKRRPQATGDFVFVLTGKMSRPRADIAQQIRDAGHRVATSVSSKTTHVVAGVKPGSKYSDALARGIQIITEGDLTNILHRNHLSEEPVIVMLDGYDEQEGYECGVSFERLTDTLLVLSDEEGTMRFSRETGLPTPATYEEFGSWQLSKDAMRQYGTTRQNA